MGINPNKPSKIQPNPSHKKNKNKKKPNPAPLSAFNSLSSVLKHY